MLRKDLRTATQVRPLSVELGLISEADGSAQVSMGNTRVVASLVGPTQPRYGRHEQYDRASVDIEVELPGNQRNDNAEHMQHKRKCEKYLRDSLLSCIELQNFPRMIILFRVLVVSDDGSMFAVALNACVLALLDAGLPMNCVPNAVSLCALQVNSHTKIALDPSLQEETDCLASYNFTILPVNGQESGGIIVTDCSGAISMESLQEASDLAIQTSNALCTTMRKFMEAKLAPEVL